MIIKVVEKHKGKGSSFERLGQYILGGKRDGSVMFSRMAEYVMDLKGDGEKVAWYRISNCHSDMPAAAIGEVVAVQAQNGRSKSDKTYHLVVSLAPGEKLTREQAAGIEDEICSGLGFEGHQRVSAVHQDTDIFHVHIAVNKIHPKTFKSVEPYYPYYKLDDLAKKLEQKHGLFQANRIGDKKKSFAKVGELEAHQQQESFLRWLHDQVGSRVKDVLEQGKTWQDLHELLAQNGAVIKPRGAGLAIATADGRVGIKASSLDRKLSLKSLTERFGKYEPPKQAEKQKEARQYGKKAGPLPGPDSLYAEYQKRQEENKEGRRREMTALRERQKEQREKLKEHYRGQRQSIKTHKWMNSHAKKAAYGRLSSQMKADWDGQRKREQEQRNSVYASYPVKSWDDYLVDKAKEGNSKALSILRKRKEYRKRISQALLTVENLEEAKDVIKPYLRPSVSKNGRVVYRAKDGGVVEDEVAGIRVPTVTEAATVLALSLADERFRGKALVVEGTDEFKRQMVKQSAIAGLSIRLADPALEKERQKLLAERVSSKAQTQAKSLSQENEDGKHGERKPDRSYDLGR